MPILPGAAMPPFPDPPSPGFQDLLRLGHDGPPARMTLRVARMGGPGPWRAALRMAERRRLSRLCAESRLAAARRRAALTATAAPGDPWLCRLARAVGTARGSLVALEIRS